MKRHGIASWPGRLARWLFGAPFQKLPPQYGSTVPPDLQRFEAEAAEVNRKGLGQVATQVPAHHATTRPVRVDEALERQ